MMRFFLPIPLSLSYDKNVCRHCGFGRSYAHSCDQISDAAIKWPLSEAGEGWSREPVSCADSGALRNCVSRVSEGRTHKTWALKYFPHFFQIFMQNFPRIRKICHNGVYVENRSFSEILCGLLERYWHFLDVNTDLDVFNNKLKMWAVISMCWTRSMCWTHTIWQKLIIK